MICEKLNIESILLTNSRSLRAYNEQLAFNSIIYVICFTLIVNEYVKQICFMLIVSLRNYRIIIDKLWINKYDVIFDIKYDRLIYKSNRYYYLETTFNVKSKIVSMSTISIIKKFFNYVIFKKKKTSKFEFISIKLNKET